MSAETNTTTIFPIPIDLFEPFRRMINHAADKIPQEDPESSA
jgi:hypothetical protein